MSYNVQNFVSDIGGLLGLFLGISLLSLFELTIKAISVLRRLWSILTSKVVKQRKSRNSIKKYRTQRMNSFMPDLFAIDQLFGEKIEQTRKFDVDSIGKT